MHALPHRKRFYWRGTKPRTSEEPINDYHLFRTTHDRPKIPSHLDPDGIPALPLSMGSVFPFASVPHELAEHILKFCHARDVGRFSQTSREMHKLIYPSDDNYLWRELYLLYPFDDPRKAIILLPQTSSEEIDWKGGLQSRVRVERIMLTDPATLEGALAVRALTTLVSAVDTASPASPDVAESYNLAWVYNVLVSSPLLYDTTFHNTYPIVHQLQSRLRCYLGLSHENAQSEESSKRLRDMRSASRCFVYNLRRYAHETHWGPYVVRKDGESRQVLVNWEHLEHIMNVIVINIREISSHLEDIWPKWGIESARAYSAPSIRDRDPRDWAGVEGLWRRVVCFMDYRDLFAFNFSPNYDGPLNPAYFNEPQFTEAIRLMELDLHLKDASSVPASNASSSQSDSYSDPKYPPLHFEGLCHGAHESSGLVEGSVCMFAPGVIRWSFVTAYDGSVNSWSAEGVQIGSVGSALGIGGIWSVALHEEVGDPAGPFWMWKAEEPVPQSMFHIAIF